MCTIRQTEFRVQAGANPATMKPPTQQAQPVPALEPLLADYSIEVLPKNARTHLEESGCKLPARTRVYVAHPSGAIEQVIDAVEAIAEHGFIPVPHLPARRFENEPALRDFLRKMTARAPVRQILLVGGDCAQPAGPFRESLDVLKTGMLQDHGIRCVGFAGHPDGHPRVASALLRDCLLAKCEFAAGIGLETYLATQFVFDIRKLFAWHDELVAPVLPGVPVDVGMPGLVKTSTLLRFAAECGVTASLELLGSHARRAIGLATRYSPEQALMELAAGLARQARPALRSVHFFPFGSFGATVEWLERMRKPPRRVERQAAQAVPADAD
jgi:methylenetetrahydrofolate reductase (NADPH)